jgi:hypothetical protein
MSCISLDCHNHKRTRSPHNTRCPLYEHEQKNPRGKNAGSSKFLPLSQGKHGYGRLASSGGSRHDKDRRAHAFAIKFRAVCSTKMRRQKMHTRAKKNIHHTYTHTHCNPPPSTLQSDTHSLTHKCNSLWKKMKKKVNYRIEIQPHKRTHSHHNPPSKHASPPFFRYYARVDRQSHNAAHSCNQSLKQQCKNCIACNPQTHNPNTHKNKR